MGSDAVNSAAAPEVASSLRLPAMLRGQRVTLRRWTPDDEATLGRIVAESLDHLRPWMPWARFEPLTPGARRLLIEGWEREWYAGGDVTFAVIADSEVVGSSGLHRRLGPDALEIGYWVHVDFIRRGYATELARMLTDAAFSVDGIERVEIHHNAANTRSAAVPRRLGYTLMCEVATDPKAPAEVDRECEWRVTKQQWAELRHIA